MKKTQLIELFINIKKTFVSFFSIMLFVMMGICIFAGIGWAGISLEKTVENEYDNTGFHDLDIRFPYGLSKDAVDSIRDLPAVTAAEGTYLTYNSFIFEGSPLQVKIYKVNNLVDRPSQLIGDLPRDKNEIAVERYWAENHDIQIGDTIVFDSEKGNRYLNGDTYTVTGFMETPENISVYPISYGASGFTKTPVNCIMYLPEEAFNDDAFMGYNEILVTSDSLLPYETTGEEYAQELDKLKDDIINILTPFVDDKNDEILSMNIPGFDKEYDLNIIERYSGLGIKFAGNLSDVIKSLRGSMTALFIIVGMLVCYCAVSRIVYEQSVQIGTKKALGLKNREIRVQFLAYTVLSGILGIILGILLSVFVVLPALIKVLTKSFILESYVAHFDAKEFVLLSLLELGVLIIATLIACHSILRRSAVSLLSGENGAYLKSNKLLDNSFVKKLPLFFQAVVTNLKIDRRRVFSTIVGVCGCTALVVSAMTLQQSVANSYNKHITRIQNFNIIVFYDNTVEGAEENISDILDKYNLEYGPVNTTIGGVYDIDDKLANSYLFACEDPGFYGLIDLYDPYDNKLSPEKDAWMEAAFPYAYDLHPGDEIRFIDGNGTKHHLTLGGSYEYYLTGHQLIMTSDTYENELEMDFSNNSFLIKTGDADSDLICSELMDIDGYLGFQDYVKTGKQSFDSFNSVITAIVIIYMFLSVLMALLVTLNLLVMFVHEKKRELITLMINGYPASTARKYVSLDTAFLTVIGIILGLILGNITGTLTVQSILSDGSYFMRQISPLANILAIAISTVLTLIMGAIAFRRIKKFKLSDLQQ